MHINRRRQAKRTNDTLTTRHLSLRLDADTFERLDAQSRASRQPRSRLAKTLLEEGLRMVSHPGIVFRSGPAGRRARLIGGPDVWEVARVLRVYSSSGEEGLRCAAELTGLGAEQVGDALRYYTDCRTEIDGWIEHVDEEAARAEAAWRRTPA